MIHGPMLHPGHGEEAMHPASDQKSCTVSTGFFELVEDGCNFPDMSTLVELRHLSLMLLIELECHEEPQQSDRQCHSRKCLQFEAE
jgi:hypothetical protein